MTVIKKLKSDINPVSNVFCFSGTFYFKRFHSKRIFCIKFLCFFFESVMIIGCCCPFTTKVYIQELKYQRALSLSFIKYPIPNTMPNFTSSSCPIQNRKKKLFYSLDETALNSYINTNLSGKKF